MSGAGVTAFTPGGPDPNCPDGSPPQVQTTPAEVRAYDASSPPATATNVVSGGRPSGCTGTGLSTVAESTSAVAS